LIVPSIDLMGGRTVQLVGGRELAMECGDPLPIARRFALAGEIAVIDLDAALGRGSNADLVKKVISAHPCRVGGGIRDLETAAGWLDAGAAKIIVGTAATPDLLSRLPKERLIAALDARDGEVVVEGWTKGTGAGIVGRIAELKDLVSGFLVTFVEREGRLSGTAMERVAEIVSSARPARVTIAGGITTPAEIAELDRAGADAQVGMAIYTGKMTLADAVTAVLTSDRPDGLWPTVVCDERGTALGLAYSSRESVAKAMELSRGVYQSRKRGLWIKGESSGDFQELLRITPDCDRDTLKFTVRQRGRGFCHEGTWTCWGDRKGE
jgi:phosphoribosylformimino-5-aminoimidazole carboxamide ribonucleotide (ProFAR) isomerase